MPTIFDNIETRLAEGLRNVFHRARSCAFCVGYFHLRGWDVVADLIDQLEGGENSCCRLLVGMHRPDEDQMRQLQGLHNAPAAPDGPALARLRNKITEQFKRQLEFGLPTDAAERTLRRLAEQLSAGKLRVRAFLRHPLHAKLYLVERDDPVAPLVAFVGSSNLTLAGLSAQGELNVDVLDQDAAKKLLVWFDQRWNDPMSIELTATLLELIRCSWACARDVRPYLVYLKMAYHLCEPVRSGEREFKLPKVFKGVLLDFQEKAVLLAAHHLHARGGVLLGDVVGLGKSLMATAVAKIFQEDDDSNTLIICPPNLQPMWERLVQQYQLTAYVLSLGKVIDELPQLPRYRLLIIDESQNLRNREGRRYRAIYQYIQHNEPRVILISATPYNKHYTDLSNQLRLFVDEDRDLHVRPERFFQQWAANGKTETDFLAQYQFSPRSLRAFELSPFPEDWRDLMRLFLVRRTRQFIINNYATFDPKRQRYFVTIDGRPAYFPLRRPHTLTFNVDRTDPADQYARLFTDETVDTIENLALPRYGLANYLVPDARHIATTDEQRILDNLNRAGRRLIGFCRTNLFKRLESSGAAFLLSLKRHVLRNLVTLHAVENGLPLPIGTQDPASLDTLLSDADDEFFDTEDWGTDAGQTIPPEAENQSHACIDGLRQCAARLYTLYTQHMPNRSKWLHPKFFLPALKTDLQADVEALLRLLNNAGSWVPDRDAKLNTLYQLLAHKHPTDKVLVFTQFADTASYLGTELQRRGITDLAVVTTRTPDPVAIARRFSPDTNGGLRPGEPALRVLIATDVLAEGQNLQDCHIVVNYDLPWAIIRLIQRAGRVDRIGQKHDTIHVYSFLPADGVERIIRLRQRLTERLKTNQEIIGTDESFFGEAEAGKLRDLYTEKAGILDDDAVDEDIDLASLALQVWNSAAEADRRAALALPPVVPAAMRLHPDADPTAHPPGLIAYLRFDDGTDALVRVDQNGNLVSQSLSAIFRAAACAPDTPPAPRAPNHNQLVQRCVEITVQDQAAHGGQLGPRRSIARRVYDRLMHFRDNLNRQPNLLPDQFRDALDQAIDLIYRWPLTARAREALARQLHLGITDQALAQLVVNLAQEDNLCSVTEEAEPAHKLPQIVCSLGLLEPNNRTPETP